MGLISHAIMYEIGKNNGEAEARAQACPPPQPQECTPTEKVVEKVVEVPQCLSYKTEIRQWPAFLWFGALVLIGGFILGRITRHS